MVAGRVHRRRRPGVRGADPPAGRRAPRRRRAGCSTSAAARARSPGWRRGASADVASASTRRGRRSSRRTERGGGPAYARGRRRRRCRSPTGRSTRSWPASCSSTSSTSTPPSPRSAGCCAPGGRFLFFLNHPLLQTPGQRLDRRPDPRPARAVLADRPLPRRGRDDRGGGEGRVHPVHPPAAVALRQRAGRRRPRASGRC